jgi:hypothetical protein
VARRAHRAMGGGRTRVCRPCGGSTPHSGSATVLSARRVTERAGIRLAEERWSAWFGVACKTEECRSSEPQAMTGEEREWMTRREIEPKTHRATSKAHRRPSLRASTRSASRALALSTAVLAPPAVFIQVRGRNDVPAVSADSASRSSIQRTGVEGRARRKAARAGSTGGAPSSGTPTP